MDIQTAQSAAQILQQIDALDTSISQTEALIAANGSLGSVQLTTGAPVNLAGIGLSGDQTNVILNAILINLQGLLATATASLTAIG